MIGTRRPVQLWGACLAVACCAANVAQLAAESSYDVDVQAEVKIPMRDGIRLSANVFRPKAAGKFPTILVRTPYGKGGTRGGPGHFFARRGYVFVSQDCRGRGTSEGEWEPFANEAKDGLDTHRWILQQPWSNGKIGTMGGSYVGFTQWAPAPDAGPYLKAMFPVVPLVDPYSDVAYVGGAFQLALMMGWGAAMSGQGNVNGWTRERWNQALRTLPLRTWDRTLGAKVQYLRDWVAHPQFDAYWARSSIRGRGGQITAPMYVVGGWYDIFAKSVLEHVAAVRAARSGPRRQTIHVLMGPWAHGISRDGRVGSLDFGKQAVVDLNAIRARWFDHWLKGQSTDGERWPPYRIFVMGRNQWRDEPQWPLARTRYTPYYFHSGGSANTLHGDGTLNTVKPGSEPTDRYVYDPDDPVPTLGGCNLVHCPIGPHDQTEAEKRQDVLVFTSERLKQEVEVTGPVKVVLYAASTARDTDWTAKLVDVHPDGRAFNLCDGIVRARYRESTTRPTLIEPGRVYRYEIDLWVTSNVFLPGHRIRVEISSSNFPRFDRNPNTGHPFGADAEMQKATQTVYHDADHPSHILLPVIP
ncbi:MAG: CocE/NonD family hydrolase [Planctomycetes bacterium]|nr:CocE/NonD family hydrolase [Planctomycetota bacterium]